MLIARRQMDKIRDKRNWLLKIYITIIRQKGTPEYTARGVFLGLFIGLFIPFLFQIVTVLPLAFIFRANKIMAVAFTFVTNHVTIFFIYPVQCYIGSYLVGRPLSYEKVKAFFMEFFSKDISYSALFKGGLDITMSFFAGGLLFAILASVPGYYISLHLVRRHRERVALKKARRQQKLLNKESRA